MKLKANALGRRVQPGSAVPGWHRDGGADGAGLEAWRCPPCRPSGARSDRGCAAGLRRSHCREAARGRHSGPRRIPGPQLLGQVLWQVLVLRGTSQLVTVGALPFLHIHAPCHDLSTFSPSLQPHLKSFVASVFIGDFNYVLRWKSQSIKIHSLDYRFSIDFEINHYSSQWMFLFESRPRLARYIPTYSDHHVYLL